MIHKKNMRYAWAVADATAFYNYAHGHPEEECQQRLTGARRASRGRNLPYSIMQACVGSGLWEEL